MKKFIIILFICLIPCLCFADEPSLVDYSYLYEDDSFNVDYGYIYDDAQLEKYRYIDEKYQTTSPAPPTENTSNYTQAGPAYIETDTGSQVGYFSSESGQGTYFIPTSGDVAQSGNILINTKTGHTTGIIVDSQDGTGMPYVIPTN